jgi:RimJ/RimL family protein N-acetyltransferase
MARAEKTGDYPMFFRSERLFLRPAWPEDWEELFQLINDEGVVRNLARAPWPYSPEDAREFARQAQQRLLPHFIVTLPGAKGSPIIGSAGLAEDGGRPELGYWIAREHWGRGYATEAARAVLCTARALGHRRVFAGHYADNPASGRVLVTAGFRPTGEIRRRYSRGRGCDAPCVEYALDLDNICGGNENEDARMVA